MIEASNPGKIINKVYALSALRILVVSAIMFLAFRQGFTSGICFLAAFIVGRWIWALLLIKKKDKLKEE